MKNAIRSLLSRPSTQPILLQLLKLCHAGLNYGGGQSVMDSGEKEALEFLHCAFESDSRTVMLFDVGANDGIYLHSALKIFGQKLKAYSFEPQSASFEILRERFESDPRVELRKAAVGQEPGTANLFFGSDCETTASLHRNAILHQTRSETVQLTTVDQVCKESGIERIDLLKIDTEGHEIDVLLGASAMMEANRIFSIQVEFGDTFLHTRHHFFDLWNLLSPKYIVYRILRHGLAELPRYSPDLEIYKAANFLCILRR